MHVDRATFLLLATTMAAGCSPHAPEPAAPSTTGPTPTAAPETTAPAATSPPTVEHRPPPTKEGMGGIAPTQEGGGVYTPPPHKSSKPFNTTSCTTDDVGQPASCAGLKFDKSCNPFPFVVEACNDARKYYKPKIAERAVACIRHKSPQQLCDAMHTYDCKDEALRSACVDGTTNQVCGQIVQSCPGIAMAECRGYLSGMSDVGRAAMLTCMKSDCTYGLYSCTESL